MTSLWLRQPVTPKENVLRLSYQETVLIRHLVTVTLVIALECPWWSCQFSLPVGVIRNFYNQPHCMRSEIKNVFMLSCTWNPEWASVSPVIKGSGGSSGVRILEVPGGRNTCLSINWYYFYLILNPCEAAMRIKITKLGGKRRNGRKGIREGKKHFLRGFLP